MVDQFYGPTSVCIGFNLYLLCSQRLPVSERGSQYQHFFINLQNIIWRAQLKSTKKSMQVLNLKGICATNINKVGNVFYFGVFFSHPLKFCVGWLIQTQQWPLIDCSSMHSWWWELFGTAVLWLTAVVHAMGMEEELGAHKTVLRTFRRCMQYSTHIRQINVQYVHTKCVRLYWRAFIAWLLIQGRF